MSIRNELLEQILSATGGGFNPTTGMAIDRLIDAESLASVQNPTGLGVANSMNIEFGAAQNSVADPVMVDVNGKLTINTTGTYRIKVALQFGKGTSVGEAEILFRVLVNSIQVGRSINYIIDDQKSTAYFENDTWITLSAGTEIEFEVMRDLNGNDSGGLVMYTPTVEAGNEWGNAPTAALRVERWVNA